MECVDNHSDTQMTMKDVLAMITSAQSTIIEQTDMFTESTKLYPPTLMTGEQRTPESLKTADTGFVSKAFRSVECNPETIKRLKDIEKVLSSLQDTKQKTEDDISEIKQWKGNFETEHSDIGIMVENVSKKQKKNFKNLRKQLIEQDNKIEELNQQIESLKTKESDKDKTLEKLSLDMKEYENNLHTLNEEMRVYTDKIDQITFKEIQRHSDLISAIQKDTTKTFDTLLSKHVVMCKLLQQRLMPIDKIFETYNQNSEAREGKMKKIANLEIEVLKLSNDFQSIANQQVKHSTPGFIASQGRCEEKVYDRHQVFTFSAVERNVGNHFDPNTGVFTAPVHGLYKASITIKQTGDHAITAWVLHKSGGKMSRLGGVNTQDQSVEASRTFEVLMKSGDVLYSATGYKDLECTHFSCSLFDD
ncbi:putative leucine-rich repeat-containing protein DDB_G0290503 [Physella acuta]|uniref:putative leucine-rich repeat-containing protein DDB_G0290503 n=1 Tax=Physella acuta TaxID=109671 RepID=UPI0027DE585B|nr:putative leucine-rich repeat-containing protein DDB_G0290503 [Physella acuta]